MPSNLKRRRSIWELMAVRGSLNTTTSFAEIVDSGRVDRGATSIFAVVE
jgi:hypothetical protein